MLDDLANTPALSGLDIAARRLLTRLQTLRETTGRRQAHLDDLIRDAETWLHRRAAWNNRDRALYRTGAAFEPTGGHLLDDVQLSGLDALGARGVLLLAEVAANHPGLPLSGIISILFASPHGPLITQWGRWSRFHWLSALHRAETEEFLQTKAGRDPKAAWRTRPVTKRQAFLAQEMVRALNVPPPEFRNRGEAFDWIYRQGGNPRFWEPPPAPELPK